MSLEPYRRKRDFAKTREPAPDAAVPKSARAIFVVQLHHASRRHFDFRLQVGDTLRSWAVPKGPSYDPAVKRLAVEVEDHPVAYADFEGDIEEGYGKGHVDTFDRGIWATAGDAQAQLRKGHLTFDLYGERLKGRWHLVRSGRKERQPAWFLIKADDAYAGDVEADDLLDATMRRSTRRAAKTPATRALAKRATARRKTPPKARKVSLATLRKAVVATKGATKAGPTRDFFAPQLARLHEAPPRGGASWSRANWGAKKSRVGPAFVAPFVATTALRSVASDTLRALGGVFLRAVARLARARVAGVFAARRVLRLIVASRRSSASTSPAYASSALMRNQAGWRSLRPLRTRCQRPFRRSP